jgi:hypothetical protein
MPKLTDKYGSHRRAHGTQHQRDKRSFEQSSCAAYRSMEKQFWRREKMRRRLQAKLKAKRGISCKN